MSKAVKYKLYNVTVSLPLLSYSVLRLITPFTAAHNCFQFVLLAFDNPTLGNHSAYEELPAISVTYAFRTTSFCLLFKSSHNLIIKTLRCIKIIL